MTIGHRLHERDHRRGVAVEESRIEHYFELATAQLVVRVAETGHDLVLSGDGPSGFQVE